LRTGLLNKKEDIHPKNEKYLLKEGKYLPKEENCLPKQEKLLPLRDRWMFKSIDTFWFTIFMINIFIHRIHSNSSPEKSFYFTDFMKVRQLSGQITKIDSDLSIFKKSKIY
jgi:hypothetical protein